MKLLFFISCFLLIITTTKGQDTIINSDNYKFKIGAKFIFEKSGDPSVSSELYRTLSTGAQITYKINGSDFSLSSGLYYYNKIFENSYSINDTLSPFPIGRHVPIAYHNISLPISIRCDTEIFYFSIGAYLDYLIETSFKEEEDQYYKDMISDIRVDRKLNSGFILIIGLEKPINNHLSVFVEGRLVQNMTSTLLNSRKNFTASMVNHGFALGANYKIIKN